MPSLSDEWNTPKWLAERVGQFDFDPCSNSRSHIDALDFASLENGDDGLVLDWHGSVWINPPYSNPLPWMDKLRVEIDGGRCREAMALVKLDTSTKWWKALTLNKDFVSLWLFNNRLRFEPPPGVKASSNNFCSALVHYRRYGRDLKLDDVAQLWIAPP